MDKFVPELHDVGKLLGKRIKRDGQLDSVLEDGTLVGSGHCFVEVDFKKEFKEPTTFSWKGIKYHHDLGLIKDKEEKKVLFLLCMADHLAASTARVLREKRGAKRRIYSLWKGWLEEPKLISKKEELEELFCFLNSDPDFEKYKDRYPLHLAPEEPSQPINVTSLLTHSLLVGRFYRVLLNSIPDTKIEGADKPEEVEKETKLCFIQGRVKFPQYLGRVADLNIFKLLEDCLEGLKEDHTDNLLFHTLDSFELFGEESLINSALSGFLEKGFYIELKILSSTLSRLRDENIPKLLSSIEDEDISHKVIYPDNMLKPSIHPPLCEVCQMREATERWPRTDPVEEICPTCKGVREAGPESKWRKLSEWEEEDIDVAWIRLSLDRDRLNETLLKLFKEYCRKVFWRGETNNALRDFRPLAVTYDFVEEYKGFLEEFHQKLGQLFPDQYETISAKAKELYAARLEALTGLMKILEAFYELHKSHFPACRESPVKIGISISSPKYPYFKHWQILTNRDNPGVYINLIGKGEIGTEVEYLEEIILRAKGFDEIGKSSLYKLSEVARLSEGMATALMADKREGYNRLLPMGLRFSEILTLTKILSD